MFLPSRAHTTLPLRPAVNFKGASRLPALSHRMQNEPLDLTARRESGLFCNWRFGMCASDCDPRQSAFGITSRTHHHLGRMVFRAVDRMQSTGMLYDIIVLGEGHCVKACALTRAVTTRSAPWGASESRPVSCVSAYYLEVAGDPERTSTSRSVGGRCGLSRPPIASPFAIPAPGAIQARGYCIRVW